MNLRFLCLTACLLPLGCSDDSATGGSGGEAGAPVAGGAESGGAPETGGAGGEPAVGGAGGDGAGCPAVSLLPDAVLIACEEAGPLAIADAGEIECSDSAGQELVVLYELPAAVGDCVYLRVDNAGAPANGPAPLVALVDPAGKSVELTADFPCAVAPLVGNCPEGGAAIETAGTAHVLVSLVEVEACSLTIPYQLTVSVNGVDVALTPLCSDDIHDVFP